MNQPSWQDVQRIVLHGSPWRFARHLTLCFGNESQPLHFLAGLKKLDPACWPSAANPEVRRGEGQPVVQASLGFSRRGLEHLRIRDHVLALFALKSPAFWAGAALRAGRQLGLAGASSPTQWDRAFDFVALDAVLSLHAMDEEVLEQAQRQVRLLAAYAKVQTRSLEPARTLPPPKQAAQQPQTQPQPKGQWVHFGYLDGLSRVAIEGWPPHEDGKHSASRHKAGEFLLGHQQDSGANPWIAGPGLRVWPQEVRDFFCNGSFGVLVQVEQAVTEFDDFVQQAAKATDLDPDTIRAKLCGRYPDGRPLAAPKAQPTDDFDYQQDGKGLLCPFGAHIRRMNPRGEDLPHAVRARPLLRRGMPYGEPWSPENRGDGNKRGLIGQFFCANIEDQFEHLVGQWGDRVPIGSKDGGGARDPLSGAHAPGDGPFLIPLEGKPALRLEGLRPFIRTQGAAYLFYPSRPVLEGIAFEKRWLAPIDEDDE